MDRRELEIMLNEAFDRGIVSVGHLVHETVEVGFLNELGRTVGFTLNGWKEAIETIPVDPVSYTHLDVYKRQRLLYEIWSHSD